MTVKKKSVKKASVKKAVTKKRVVEKKAPIKKRAVKPVELDDYGLNHKEREFADLYRGGDKEVRGNAKRSYMRVHPRVKERTAETEGAKLLRKPEIDSYLRMKSKEIADKCDIDAEWVLRQAVAVHERCMQASPVLDRKGEQVYVDTPEGDMVPAFTFDAPGANKSLEIVGKHVDVQAFKEKVDVTSNGKTLNNWTVNPVTTKKNG